MLPVVDSTLETCYFTKFFAISILKNLISSNVHGYFHLRKMLSLLPIFSDLYAVESDTIVGLVFFSRLKNKNTTSKKGRTILTALINYRI